MNTIVLTYGWTVLGIDNAGTNCANNSLKFSKIVKVSVAYMVILLMQQLLACMLTAKLIRDPIRRRYKHK